MKPHFAKPPLTQSAGVADQSDCVVRQDRLAFIYPRMGQNSLRKPPAIPGFKTVAHKFPRRKARIATWRKILFLENPTTGTKVRVQYDRAHGWLKHMKVTVIGSDATGILWPELRTICDAFEDFQICMLELAFDFNKASGVDQEYVKRHALFGKSRPVELSHYPDSLRYGTRGSAKMVRCYWKPQVQAYRVEFEFHSNWLGLPQTDYLLHLFNVTERAFRFVNVNWDALDAHLSKKGAPGKQIAAGARLHCGSLHKLLRYLRSAGVNNLQKFLCRARTDAQIRKAIDAWCDSVSPRVRNRIGANEAAEH